MPEIDIFLSLLLPYHTKYPEFNEEFLENKMFSHSSKKQNKREMPAEI